MKGPEDSEILRKRKPLATRQRTTAAARRKQQKKRVARPRVPGGKALARQIFFLEQRRLDGVLNRSTNLMNLAKKLRSPKRAKSSVTDGEGAPPSLLTALRQKDALESSA